MPVATDAVSQTKYIGAVVGAQIDPDAVINCKMADGTFVTLDAQAITAVAMVVRVHVQACFDREAELKAQIELPARQKRLRQWTSTQAGCEMKGRAGFGIRTP